VTCRELSEFIADYVDGQLPPSVRVSFDVHLSRCANCRRYLAQYRATVEAGRSALADPGVPVGDVPEEVLEAIQAALGPWREATGRPLGPV
jgi:anti-sigma factor RsiW